jgi:hypothetical protein
MYSKVYSVSAVRRNGTSLYSCARKFAILFWQQRKTKPLRFKKKKKNLVAVATAHHKKHRAVRLERD